MVWSGGPGIVVLVAERWLVMGWVENGWVVGCMGPFSSPLSFGDAPTWASCAGMVATRRAFDDIRKINNASCIAAGNDAG